MRKKKNNYTITVAGVAFHCCQTFFFGLFVISFFLLLLLNVTILVKMYVCIDQSIGIVV